MIKLLILFGAGYFAYRTLKSWMEGDGAENRRMRGRPAAEIEDVMVKDPFCEVYFPKRTGVHLRFKGEDLYFCSDACKEKFLAAQKKGRSEKERSE